MSITPAVVSYAIVARQKNAVFIPNRNEIVNYLNENALSGDVVLLMGALDVSLSDFACTVFAGLE